LKMPPVSQWLPHADYIRHERGEIVGREVASTN